MEGGTSGAIIVFALGTLPGVVALEMWEYGRPRVRDRAGARALGQFLLLSLAVWALAVLVFDAGGHLATAIDARTGQARIEAYEALSWRLFAASVMVGAVLRLGSLGLRLYANRIVEGQGENDLEEVSPLGRVALGMASLTFAWDELLARLRRSKTPQIVHVRFLDGSEAYGIFAAGGRADFQADGRGMVLSAEFVLRDGELVRVPDSSGLFIAPEGVASVGFIRMPPVAAEIKR